MDDLYPWSSSTPARDANPSLTDDFSIYIDNTYGVFNYNTIDFGNPSAEGFDASFTIESWVKTQPSDDRQVLFWITGNDRCPSLSFSIYADFTVYLTTLGVADIYTGAKIPEDDGWHHIACTFDQPNQRLLTYVDGKLASDNPRNNNASGDPLSNWNVNFSSHSNEGRVGVEATGQHPFTGYIDRLRFWKGVLSVDQLDYANYKPVTSQPVIIIQPKSQTVSEEGSVTFSVVAGGTAPLSYQWYKGSSKISGATSASYTINDIKSNDAGKYTVKVSNSIGSVTSSSAILTVYDGSQGFIVTCYQSYTVIGNINQAEDCIANPLQWIVDPVVKMYDVINFNDWRYYMKNYFDNPVVFPGQSEYEDVDNFVTLVEANVIIPEAGYWTFGVVYDDGFKLDITGNGVNFSSSYPDLIDDGGTFSSFNFPVAGTYHIRLLHFEGPAQAWLELCAAKGQYDSFNNNFRLVGDIANGGLAVGKETVNVKPTITTQPKSQTVNVGSSVTFSVTATGTEPLSYQWKKNGSDISGATVSTYKISSVTTGDAGSYTVTVSNSAGSVTSSAATLTVNVPVTLSSITINGSSSVNVGSTATYTCTATYSNGATKTVTPTWAISSGTSYASITSAGVLTGKAAGTATIQAKYTDGGVTKTATKNITVNAVVVKPSITTQPKSQTVNEGSSVTFSVTASGTTPLSYQWYKGSSKISGATSASYKISSVKTSDEGSYKVTVSNSAGSVTSSAATLTVNGTTPIDPNGTAVRSVSRSGKSATVTLKLEPGEDVSVMFVEEHVPAGVSISVNDGGTYVASRNMIRWSFLDGNAREISYVLTVADDFDGKVSLSGEVTFDETTVTVTGTSEIDFAILTHPADMDNDFEISTKEIASYALAWTKGQNWSREPADIPVTYVARAAMIWVNGGYYTYDSGKAEPSCWVSTNVKPASVELASDSVNVRTINVLEGKADVSLEVIPASGISVYFVEEQLPAGMNLNVTNISDGGKYVEGRGLIRWSFLDAEPRTLTYTLEPETGFSGIIPLNGEVTFDEETFVTEGDTEANFGGGADVPVITAAYFGGMLIEGTIGGTYVIEYSEDGVNWTKADEITLTASSMYWADLTSANSPKRLYRAKVK